MANKITVALAGLGSRGKDTYAKAAKIHPDKIEIVAIADVNPKKVEMVAEEYHIPKERCYTSAEEMLKEEKLEDISPFAYEITYIEDNKILGSLKYSLIYDRMEIDNIIVEPSHRGKGIGNKLMSYLISVAIENRVDNITLEVRVSNDIARNLYKKFNFNEVAIRKYYYGDEDAILMEKQVM